MSEWRQNLVRASRHFTVPIAALLLTTTALAIPWTLRMSMARAAGGGVDRPGPHRLLWIEDLLPPIVLLALVASMLGLRRSWPAHVALVAAALAFAGAYLGWLPWPATPDAANLALVAATFVGLYALWRSWPAQAALAGTAVLALVEGGLGWTWPVPTQPPPVTARELAGAYVPLVAGATALLLFVGCIRRAHRGADRLLVGSLVALSTSLVLSSAGDGLVARRWLDAETASRVADAVEAVGAFTAVILLGRAALVAARRRDAPELLTCAPLMAVVVLAHGDLAQYWATAVQRSQIPRLQSVLAEQDIEPIGSTDTAPGVALKGQWLVLLKREGRPRLLEGKQFMRGSLPYRHFVVADRRTRVADATAPLSTMNWRQLALVRVRRFDVPAAVRDRFLFRAAERLTFEFLPIFPPERVVRWGEDFRRASEVCFPLAEARATARLANVIADAKCLAIAPGPSQAPSLDGLDSLDPPARTTPDVLLRSSSVRALGLGALLGLVIVAALWTRERDRTTLRRAGRTLALPLSLAVLSVALALAVSFFAAN